MFSELNFAYPNDKGKIPNIPVTHRCSFEYLGFNILVKTNCVQVITFLEYYLGRARKTLSAKGETLTIEFYIHPEYSGNNPGKVIARLQDDKFVILINPTLGIANGKTGNISVYMSPSHFGNPLLSGRLFFERLLNYVVVRQPTCFAYHASAVGVGQKFVLLFGKQGTGKSTLAYTCIKAGMSFLADDLVARRLGSDLRNVFGQPNFTYLNSVDRKLYPELRESYRKFPRWKKFRLDLQSMYPRQLKNKGQIFAFVALERSEALKPRLAKIPVERFIKSQTEDVLMFREPKEKKLKTKILHEITNACKIVPVYRLSLCKNHALNLKAIYSLFEASS